MALPLRRATKSLSLFLSVSPFLNQKSVFKDRYPPKQKEGGFGSTDPVLLLLRLPSPLTLGHLLGTMHGSPCHAEPMHPDTIRFSAFALQRLRCSPVPRKEANMNPKAFAALEKEWKKIRDMGCRDQSKVREWREVAAEAKRDCVKAHVGRIRIFDICVEKNNELNKNVTPMDCCRETRLRLVTESLLILKPCSVARRLGYVFLVINGQKNGRSCRTLFALSPSHSMDILMLLDSCPFQTGPASSVTQDLALSLSSTSTISSRVAPQPALLRGGSSSVLSEHEFRSAVGQAFRPEDRMDCESSTFQVHPGNSVRPKPQICRRREQR